MMKKIISAIVAIFSICLISGCAAETLAATSDTKAVSYSAEESASQEVSDDEYVVAGEEFFATEAPTTTAETPESEESSPAQTEAETEATEEETTEAEETKSEEIGRMALAVVPNYVNVRTEPNVDSEVVGKIYNDCAAYILEVMEEEDGSWYLISSGQVIGYIKSEFFLVGDEADAKLEEVGVPTGIVMEEYLRVRSEPDLTNPDNVFTYYEKGTKVFIEELTEDGWAKIKSDDASSGYV